MSSLYIRTLNIIYSCKTVPQYEVAASYIELTDLPESYKQGLRTLVYTSIESLRRYNDKLNTSKRTEYI